MAWAKKKQKADADEVAALRQRVHDLEFELEEARSGQMIQRLRAEISALESKVQELRGVREDDKGVVALRDALLAARRKLVEQNTLLQRLTAHPTPYATVVHIREEEEPRLEERETTWKDFQVGSRVKIRRDSEYAHQNDGEGVIDREHSSKEGWYWVQFDNHSESKFHYRIGNPKIDSGVCDLELVDKPTVEATSWTGTGGVVLHFEGKAIEVELPKDLEVHPGDTVKVNAETMQIIEVVGTFKHGHIAMVVQAMEDHTCEVEHTDGRRIVSVGRYKDQLEKGDRVVLDVNAVVVIQNLGKSDQRFKLGATTNTDWNDIGGLADAKAALIEAVELPHQHPELFEHYGKKPPKGVLLYGPPGCGKTMLAKAVATALAKVHNGGEVVPTGYLYVKGPELLSKWVGDTEAAIRRLFARARDHKAEHGYPAVLFIDEAESLLRRRGSGVSSDMESTIVPMFLAEMDGLDENAAITLLATNRPDLLDPAVVRDGRIDRKIMVGRPDQMGAVDIFGIHLQGVPSCNGYTVGQVAHQGAEALFSDAHQLLEIEMRGNRPNMSFGLAQIVNGGMIAGIVDKAVSIALQRDLRDSTVTGIKPEDITAAIAQALEENMHLDHRDALTEYVADVQDDVLGVHKLRAGGVMV